MQDKVYCYPESNVLINRLNITDSHALFKPNKKSQKTANFQALS